jgi:hypothetical protein
MGSCRSAAQESTRFVDPRWRASGALLAGRDTREKVMGSETRKEIRFFVSYAHEDDEYVEPFLRGLKEMLAPSKTYHFRFWQDVDILPGESWPQEIRHALESCTLGLLLVSPAMLASPYILANELPMFVGSGDKPVIPVMLKKINLRRHDLKGLHEAQLFRLKAGPNNYRSFAQCGSSQRSDFLYDLHEKIEERLDKLLQ